MRKSVDRTVKLKPFFLKLNKKHTVPRVTSYTAESLERHTELAPYAPGVAELQQYATAGDTVRYGEKLRELNDAGLNFRSTKGTVYLIRDEGETIDVEIALQVKGHSLTWYFWVEGAMDQYPQEFRDKLYKQAAVCHQKVAAGCDLYYRGSNSIHIKLMHHHETESNHNHNHYRLRDNKEYTPEDFEQHMKGFYGCEIENEFFSEGEIDYILAEFEVFYAQWHIKIEGESAAERYLSEPSQRLNTGDMIELHIFGSMQEPCRLSVDELKVDYNAARKAIEDRLAGVGEAEQAELNKEIELVDSQYQALLAFRAHGGVRGLNAGIASARQVEGSQNPTIKARQVMDDRSGKEVPDIPEWATSLNERIARSQTQMLALAILRLDPRDVENDISHEWAKKILKELGIDVEKELKKMIAERGGDAPVKDAASAEQKRFKEQVAEGRADAIDAALRDVTNTEPKIP